MNFFKAGKSTQKTLPLILAALVTFALCANVSAQTVPLAKSRVETIGGKQKLITSRLKTILISHFTYGYDHTIGIPNLIETVYRLGAAEGWKVDSITDGTLLTATKLKTYNIFFANYISGFASKTPVDAPYKKAVQDFVETQGGGLFIMHATGDSKASANWDWYYQVAHPVLYIQDNPAGKGPAAAFILPTAKTSPVMEGVSFQGKDTTVLNNSELHLFTKIITDVHPNANVYMAVDGNKCGTCLSPIYKTPGGYPISWSFPAGKGTIGYFMEGHDLQTMTSMHQDVWDKYFKQLLYTVAGYDTSDVTGINNTNQTFPVESSGITFHPTGEIGALISKPGFHTVALFDMSGHKVKEEKGTVYPVDYNFTQDMKGAKSGVYVMRVAVGNRVQTKRYILN